MKQSHLEIVAKLDLTGDRDINTLIDAPQLADQHGDPLPAKFDDCMRTALQQLELPPLAEGDHVLVHYPFVFNKN